MSNPSTTSIRAWLQRSPHPASLRTDGGETIALVGRNKWIEALTAIEALGPESLEALDKDGNILRAIKLGASTSGTTSTPKDDQLTALARIMMQVGDQSAARHEAAFKESFSALLALANMMNARLTSMEKAYLALIHRHAETVEAAAELAGAEADSGLDGMAAAFLGQIAAGKLNGAGDKADKKS